MLSGVISIGGKPKAALPAFAFFITCSACSSVISSSSTLAFVGSTFCAPSNKSDNSLSTFPISLSILPLSSGANLSLCLISSFLFNNNAIALFLSAVSKSVGTLGINPLISFIKFISASPSSFVFVPSFIWSFIF